ncbi:MULTISPECIES: PD40 domain-containing protein [Microbacterium]|uniref:PD40 domain-containing protein n=1 Tax=Microbacterium TaxID=33882 RepID=UPI00146D4398|nr:MULTISPECIES: PD40 domain-containing protein [Microbacterium]
MGARANANLIDRGPAADAERPADRRARRTLSHAVIAGLIATGLAWSPAAPASAEAIAAPEFEYAAGSDVYLVSRTDRGESGDPSLSTDGQSVAYVSTAADLAALTRPGVPNVFLATAASGSRDPFSGAPELVSRPDRSLAQVSADGMSHSPAVSGDGRYVAFVSRARNLVPEQGPSDHAGVFVRDTVEETTLRLDAGVEPDGASADPDITEDGRFVVFESDATNLSAGDTNGATDVFVADLDANADGTRGDVSVTRVLPGRSVPGGLGEPAISGDGEWIVVTARVADPAAASPRASTAPNLFRIHRATGRAEPVLTGARTGAVDATGGFIAARVEDCGGSPAIVGAMLDRHGRWVVAAVDESAATVTDASAPAISADGSTIVYAGIRDADAGEVSANVPSEDLVVRSSEMRWTDAAPAGAECATSGEASVVVGPGESASVSASGRTVAVAGPGDMSAAARSVTAIDLHTHEGLSVTNAIREAPVPGYVTGAAIADIPAEALERDAHELARLPLARLEGTDLSELGPALHDLPLDRLPLGDASISDLPISRADLPGGWDALLADSPFADDVAAHVTLRDVMEWAAEADAGSGSSEESAQAAVLGLRLGDLALAGTPVGSLSLASLLLGDVPLADLPIDGSGDVLARWERAAAAQGIELELSEETSLVEVDSAGMDLGAVGLADVAFVSRAVGERGETPSPQGTPTPESTPTPEPTPTSTPTPTATPAPKATPAPIVTPNPHASTSPEPQTVGAALLSLVGSTGVPWEAFDPALLPADAATEDSTGSSCEGAACGRTASFRFALDPGPGEAVRFPDAVASVRLPAVTAPTSVRVAEAGPESTIVEGPYEGTIDVDGSVVRLPLDDAIAGTVRSVSIDYTASRGLGAWALSATLSAGQGVARDVVSTADLPVAGETGTEDDRAPETEIDSAPLLVEATVRYGAFDSDATAATEETSADEQWYRVAPPQPGKRLTVAVRSSAHPLAVTLWEPVSATTPLGVPVTRDTAITPVPGGAQAIGSGFPAVEGYDLVDHAEAGAGESATVGGRWSDADSDAPWLVRVTRTAGATEAGRYGIHVQTRTEPVAPRCAPWVPPAPAIPDDGGFYDPFAPVDPYAPIDPFAPLDPFDPFGLDIAQTPALPTSDEVTSSTNTVFLTDLTRMRDLHGAEAVDEVLTAIRALDGTGVVGEDSVSGAVLTVETDPAVASARASLDADPCSVAARQELVAAINRYVESAIGSQRQAVSAIVIVGGDDVIPHAPIPQDDAVAERAHAAALRLPASQGTCSAATTAGAVDPCATPYAAITAGSFLLSDDPYALPDAYPALGGHLYVPTVGIGRLVDTPDEIRAQLDRFRRADGILKADSLLAGGYGPWSDLPDAMSAALSWRTGRGDVLLESAWTAEDVEAALSPEAGAGAPGIISLNGVGDERRMLPGAAFADDGESAGDPLEAEAYRSSLDIGEGLDETAADGPFDGALVLSLGCHGGIHLPDSVYGDRAHWVDSFAAAGGFIGNTGCGLADETTLALSERLMAVYADWIGVSAADGPVSAGAALAYAKQSSLAGSPHHTAFDATATMQAVFYGVPLYTFEDSTKEPPLPPPASDSAAEAVEGPVTATLAPSLATVTRTDSSGAARAFVTADGGLPLSVPGQALLPSVIRTVPSTDASGAVPRGVLVTALSSRWSDVARPAVAVPTSGGGVPPVAGDAPASPSALVALTRLTGPDGPATLLVATAARVPANTDAGIEVFPEMDVEVLYGDAGDILPPVIGDVGAGDEFRVTVEDPSSSGSIVRALLLIQPAKDARDGDVRPWEAVELRSAGDQWSADVSDETDGPYRWILQVVDAGGNVTTAVGESD